MKVGLNLIFLVPDETGGMEVAARELIPALIALAPEIRFTAFINRETAAAKDGPWGQLLPAVTVPVNARNRVGWVFGEQTLLPRLAAREGVDLLHSLASTAPAWGRFRRVVSVHDLIYAKFPEAHAGIRDLGMRVLVPMAVRRSDRVIAISRNTREDLVRLLGTPARKIDVVPQGFGLAISCEPAPEGELRQRFALGDRRVLLSMSAKRPHKNLTVLISAMARIPAERRPLLVLPGYATAHEQQLRDHARSLGVTDDVCFLGWVSGRDLEGLWATRGRVRLPIPVRGIRSARARGDGARSAGCVLERILTARGGGRRHADVRSPRPASDRKRDRKSLDRPRDGCTLA